MVSVGRAYGALGSAAEVVAPIVWGRVVLAMVFLRWRDDNTGTGEKERRRRVEKCMYLRIGDWIVERSP